MNKDWLQVQQLLFTCRSLIITISTPLLTFQLGFIWSYHWSRTCQQLRWLNRSYIYSLSWHIKVDSLTRGLKIQLNFKVYSEIYSAVWQLKGRVWRKLCRSYSDLAICEAIKIRKKTMKGTNLGSNPSKSRGKNKRARRKNNLASSYHNEKWDTSSSDRADFSLRQVSGSGICSLVEDLGLHWSFEFVSKHFLALIQERQYRLCQIARNSKNKLLLICEAFFCSCY